MAERKVKWSSDKGILSISSIDGKIVKTMVISDLFSGYSDFNETQKYIIEFGIKQAIADDFAAIDTEAGKLASAVESWDNMLANSPKARKARKATAPKTRVADTGKALKEAKGFLAAYVALDDAGKRMAASFGQNRTGFEKKVKSAKTAFDKAVVEYKKSLGEVK